MTGILTLIMFIVSILGASPCHAASPVKVGAKVLHDSGYAELAGKRIGLITNGSAMVDGIGTVNLIASSGKVRLAAVFAPEHGLRGLREDGETVVERTDERTG